MQYPDDVDDVLDNVQAFHAQIRTMAVTLPPTPAKTVIDDLLSKVSPLVDQVRKAQQTAHSALQQQADENVRQFEHTKQKFAEVQEKFANLPPVEEIKKNLVPVAAALPAGLSIQFADEILNRYTPQPVASDQNDSQAAAWQDWSVSS